MQAVRSRSRKLVRPWRPSAIAAECEVETVKARPHRISWARLLKRVFDIDMQHCPNCGGGELKIIAAILERPVIEKILTHLGLVPQPPPEGGRARRGNTSQPEPLPNDAAFTNTTPRASTQYRSWGGDSRRVGATNRIRVNPEDLTASALVNGPRTCRHRSTRRHGRPNPGASGRRRQARLGACPGPLNFLSSPMLSLQGDSDDLIE